MNQRAYCGQNHPGGDAQAEQWCRMYHRPAVPQRPIDWAVVARLKAEAERVGDGELLQIIDLAADDLMAEAALRQILVDAETDGPF
jgi:hypothetical protein